MTTAIPLLLPVLAYLFGSISTAVIVCRVLRLPDPRAAGSGNPGATNVLRLGGRKAALAALAGDVLKGLLAVLAARAIGAAPMVVALVGLGAFVGHLYPLFFGFRGGKGVATAAGVFAALDVALAGSLLLIWLALALAFRYSSLAALGAAAAAPWLTGYWLPAPGYVWMATAIAALLWWRHRGNIRRLIGGVEAKIRLGGGG